MSLKNNHNKNVDVTILKFSPTNSPLSVLRIDRIVKFKINKNLTFSKNDSLTDLSTSNMPVWVKTVWPPGCAIAV